jgi:two-component system, OmpR family, phosphate regulon sensor histidine kinase PhoR
MSDQSTRMQHLVEDLLTLSKLESAQNPLREEYVDVPELIGRLFKDAEAMSNGRHRLTLNLATEQGLKGNTEELRSALSNLISNAVRYTPDGGEIQVSWEPREEQLAFCVRDTGIGIEPHHIPRLTERFYRVDRSRSRATGGTGLGLAIVKHVLSRHQAQLDVKSQTRQGSQFCAIFPASRTMLTPTAPLPETAAQSDHD